MMHDTVTGRNDAAPGAAGGRKFDPASRALVLRNGCAAPTADVPVCSFSMFRRVLHSTLHAGGRVSALFAVPAEDGKLLLFAVLAADAAGLLYLLSTPLPRAYPSLSRSMPQCFLFERVLHEQHGIVPERHPRLLPVRFSRPGGPAVGDMDFYQVHGEETHEVAVGPVHAGIIECGHFRFQCLGEEVMHLDISLGYHHRGIEALLAGGPDKRGAHLAEVVSGDATVAHAWTWWGALEALAGRKASPRGKILRSLALELERLANHTGDLGAMAGDIGFLPAAAYCGRLRGDWLNMTAMLCGNRFGRGFVAMGGTSRVPDDGTLRRLKETLRATARDVEGAVRLFRDASSVRGRLTGVGGVSREDATALGLVGPAARACGLPRDVRSTHPLDGLPAPPEMQTAPWGDVYARALVRHSEIRASVAYCRKLLEDFSDDEGRELPADFQDDGRDASHHTPPANSRPAPRVPSDDRDHARPGAARRPSETRSAGALPGAMPCEVMPHPAPSSVAVCMEAVPHPAPSSVAVCMEAVPHPAPSSVAVCMTESWRGEVCRVMLTDEHGRIRASSTVDASFHNWAGLAVAVRGGQISDFPLCNKSFNLSYCGHDL